MFKFIKIAVVTGIIFHEFLAVCMGQTDLDSIMQKRNTAYFDYLLLSENKGESTWLKMSQLNIHANRVIELDNTLLNEFLKSEIETNKQLEDKLEKLNFELALVRKEAELQNLVIEENKYTVKLLLFFLGSIGLLFLVLIILFIDRQIRYRSIKLELERTWAIQEELKKDREYQHDIQRLNKQIGELTFKNSRLMNELEDMIKLKRENEDKLEKEIQSKKLIEEEIKKLILQIKTH